MNSAESTPLTARRGAPLQGRVRVPGDKSISHRALILGRAHRGRNHHQPGCWKARTCCIRRRPCARSAPASSAAATASGAFTGSASAASRNRRARSTSAIPAPAAGWRIGAVAGSPVTATFDGDASLRKRPMRRVLDPLEKMGARVIEAADGGRLPLTCKARAIRCRSFTSRRCRRRNSNRRCCSQALPRLARPW